MSDSIREKWDNIYQQGEPDASKACSLLQNYHHLLPETGKALDFACGLAHNGVLLARLGLEVCAWDISQVAVDKINTFARQNALTLSATQKDLSTAEGVSERFDVIIISHYLDRQLFAVLPQWLNPGGLLFYQTFPRSATPQYSGPSNPDFRLADQELIKALYPQLHIKVYQEQGALGDCSQGVRDLIYLVAQKPPG